MKKIFSALILASAALALPVNAFAAMSFTDLQDVTKLAYGEFTTRNPEHVQHFTGFKTWISGDDARVKVYVNHDGMAMEYNFLCHRHDTGLECHAQ